MWAVDHYDIEPDVITSAKALRVGATVSRSDIFPSETSRLSSTWGAGDILGSMRGALTLAAIEDHDLLDNAAEKGTYFMDRLREISAGRSLVEDVRGLGLMTALEFDTADRRDAVMETALQHGLLTLGCGQKSLRLLPPLDVTERELELCLDILDSVFTEVAGAVASA
jgi:4-aminobutyrate aminotransferase